MAFGSIWIYADAGPGGAAAWKSGQLFVKQSDGTWKQVVHLYEKTSATVWTERYNADVTPPGVIAMTNGAFNTTTGVYSLSAKLAADADVAGGCIKVSTTAYPTLPGQLTTGDCFTNTQADGQPYWNWTGAPGSTTTRATPKLLNSKKYYFSGWTRDSSGNWSAPAQFTYTTPLPPAPTKVLTTKTAYVNTTDSASYRAAYGWRTDNKMVYQGGDQNLQGFWFYGTAIATLLKNADSVTKIEIYIERNSSAHGSSGAGNIYVGHHGLTTQPSGAPSSNAITGEYNIVDLNRGTALWCTVSSSWYASFKSGAYRGLGMQYATTSTSSSYYNICNGNGTSGGKLRITWKEYV